MAGDAPYEPPIAEAREASFRARLLEIGVPANRIDELLASWSLIAHRRRLEPWDAMYWIGAADWLLGEIAAQEASSTVA
jgi:hypothetical protein